MNFDNTNIYKKAREIAGLTQESVIELLKDEISLRTLQYYESGERIPSSTRVKQLVKLYNAEWLGYMHLQQNDDLGKIVLPSIDLNTLSLSVLNFQKEYTDIDDIKKRMVEIACDNKIDEHEEEEWNDVKKEINELISAAFSLYLIKSKNLDGRG
ncbi:helix-turn-helix domain-containing protein [Tepidibacter mesophilus]|uniref:helix-turn-helix domain-containing protein n=1 Tax=Tepidibacter mesophilus TaxID=655607 RepID=UPI000C07FA6D|nr:helix-turn-helix transcriptional regulator [Tepidibacter mesophilus]